MRPVSRVPRHRPIRIRRRADTPQNVPACQRRGQHLTHRGRARTRSDGGKHHSHATGLRSALGLLVTGRSCGPADSPSRSGSQGRAERVCVSADRGTDAWSPRPQLARQPVSGRGGCYRLRERRGNGNDGVRITRKRDGRVPNEKGRNCGRAPEPCRAPVRAGASTDWSE